MAFQSLLHVRDQRSAGTVAGSPSLGTNIRVLNTILENDIGASLSSNRVTLTAGTYMCRAVVPGYRTDEHRACLYNFSDSNIELVGSNNFAASSGTPRQQNPSMVQGRFTINSTKTFELRQEINSTAGATQGLGNESTSGKVEAYADLMIRKINKDFPLMHIRDEKSANTDGGSASALTFNVRTLNTIKGINEIIGASLSSDTITLPAGGYYVFIWAPMYDTLEGKAHFYNKDDATYDIVGANMYDRASTNQGNASITQGYFEISSEKDFEIRHWIRDAQATNGLGRKMNDGSVEVYTEVLIRKLI